MKRTLVAALLVLVFSVGAFAADIKIDGRVEYGLSKTGDADAVWYADPTARVRFFNDFFEVRLTGKTVLNDADLLSECDIERVWDLDWCHEHDRWELDCTDDIVLDEDYSLTTGSHYGVIVDRANVKMPVGELGAFVAGRAYFGTSDWDNLGRTYDGLGWSGTFDALSLKAMYDVKNKTFGGRASYALDLGDNKLTLGGGAFKVKDEDETTWAADARFDFGEALDVYGELEYDVWDDDLEEYVDKSYICGEARLAGFEFVAGREIEDEVTEVYVEKTLNNVLLHLGYEKPDEADDGLVKCWARYNF